MQPIIVRSLVALTLIASGSVLAQTPPTSAADSTRKPGPTVIPAAAPAEGEVTHVVKKGDTLWDIARAYLKDPFRWPEVFRRNTDVVENPHWIYPGEVIRIPQSEVRAEVLERLTAKPAAPAAAPVAAAPAAAAPVATALEPTVFSNRPVLVSDRLQSNGQVIGRELAGSVRVGEVEAAPFADRQGGPHGAGRLAAAYDRPGIQAKASDQRFQLQDPIFVELPSGRPARVGDQYVAYVLGPMLSDESELMIPTAIVRVENVQPGELTLARIVRQFGDIRLDQLLAPLESAVPSATMTRMPVSDGLTAHVLWVHEDPVLPSTQSYVVLTRETGLDVQVGDLFTLIDASVDESHPAPPVPAGVAQVVRVTPYAVTALVMDQDQPTIRAGMPARLTARMR
jgi:LysM repeat protein